MRVSAISAIALINAAAEDSLLLTASQLADGIAIEYVPDAFENHEGGEQVSGIPSRITARVLDWDKIPREKLKAWASAETPLQLVAIGLDGLTVQWHESVIMRRYVDRAGPMDPATQRLVLETALLTPDVYEDDDLLAHLPSWDGLESILLPVPGAYVQANAEAGTELFVRAYDKDDVLLDSATGDDGAVNLMLPEGTYRVEVQTGDPASGGDRPRLRVMGFGSLVDDTVAEIPCYGGPVHTGVASVPWTAVTGKPAIVHSMNGRTGAVTLSYADVVNALGYVPGSEVGGGSSEYDQLVIIDGGIIRGDLGNVEIWDEDGLGYGSLKLQNVIVTSTGIQSGFNADRLDSYHAGHISGAIPISDGVVNVDLNADLLDGLHAGNTSGAIPISNGTLNTNLNSQYLGGYLAAAFPRKAEDAVITGGWTASGDWGTSGNWSNTGLWAFSRNSVAASFSAPSAAGRIEFLRAGVRQGLLSYDTDAVSLLVDSGKALTLGATSGVYAKATGATTFEFGGSAGAHTTFTNAGAWTFTQRITGTDLRLTTGDIYRPDNTGVAADFGNGTNALFGALSLYNSAGSVVRASMTDAGTWTFTQNVIMSTGARLDFHDEVKSDKIDLYGGTFLIGVSSTSEWYARSPHRFRFASAVGSTGNVFEVGNTSAANFFHVESAGHAVFNHNVGSTTFASGFTGTGWRIDWSAGSGIADVEATNLTIRGRMRVYELLIQQIRATNGSVLVTPGAAKAQSVWNMGGGVYRIYMEDDLYVPHLTGDFVQARRFYYNGATRAGLFNVWGTITAVNNTGIRYYDLTLGSGSDVPAAGYEFAQYGSTNAGRQGGIYITSDDTHAPYIDIYDGLSNVADYANLGGSGRLKVRLGRLTGITDATWGTLTSYGLYSTNVYLTGKVTAVEGWIGTSTAGWAINSTGLTNGNIRIHTASLGAGEANNSLSIGYWNSSSGPMVRVRGGSGESVYMHAEAGGEAYFHMTDPAASIQMRAGNINTYLTGKYGFVLRQSGANVFYVTQDTMHAFGWTANSTSLYNTSNGGIYLSAGSTRITLGGNAAYSSMSAGIFLGLESSTPKFRLKDKLMFDGSSLVVDGTGTFTGSVNITGGTAYNGIWTRYYSVNVSTGATLLREQGDALDTEYVYQAEALTEGTSTPTYAKAYFYHNGTSWQIQTITQYGTSSNHPLLYIGGPGEPRIALHGHASFYTVGVRLNRVGRATSLSGFGAGYEATKLPAVPSGSGLFLGADYMGYYSSSAWQSFIKNDGSGQFASGAISWTTGGVLSVNRITATSGTIGALNIGTNKIYAGAGTWGSSGTPFYVDLNGSFSLGSGLKWDTATLNIVGNGTFTGTVYASAGTFTGTVTASAGTIGGWTLSSAQFYAYSTGSPTYLVGITAPSSSTSVVFSTYNNTAAVYTYYVRADGYMYNTAGGSFANGNFTWDAAGNVSLTGAINAASGTITGTLSIGAGGAVTVGGLAINASGIAMSQSDSDVTSRLKWAGGASIYERSTDGELYINSPAQVRIGAPSIHLNAGNSGYIRLLGDNVEVFNGKFRLNPIGAEPPAPATGGVLYILNTGGGTYSLRIKWASGAVDPIANG